MVIAGCSPRPVGISRAGLEHEWELRARKRVEIDYDDGCLKKEHRDWKRCRRKVVLTRILDLSTFRVKLWESAQKRSLASFCGGMIPLPCVARESCHTRVCRTILPPSRIPYGRDSPVKKIDYRPNLVSTRGFHFFFIFLSTTPPSLFVLCLFSFRPRNTKHWWTMPHSIL